MERSLNWSFYCISIFINQSKSRSNWAFLLVLLNKLIVEKFVNIEYKSPVNWIVTIIFQVRNNYEVDLLFLTFFRSREGSLRALMISDEADGTTETQVQFTLECGETDFFFSFNSAGEYNLLSGCHICRSDALATVPLSTSNGA